VLEAPAPGALELVVSSRSNRHCLWLGTDPRDAQRGSIARERCPENYLLLQHQAHRAAGESPKTGWEEPSRWRQYDSFILIAWEGAAVSVSAEAEDGRWSEVRLTWEPTKALRVSVGNLLEVDPAAGQYVFSAGAHVARHGTFGFAPYAPVRNSNGYMGAAVGLAAGAWLLAEVDHPLAEEALNAASEAFAAVVDSEQRGYFGEYAYNALSAAEYLQRVAPDRFDYRRWATVWAERDLSRCPPDWPCPPWSDTALRAVRGWRTAARITGEQKFADAAATALATFDLPQGDESIDHFLWRGTPHPFKGYNCTGAAMLLGEWGATGDARAEAMIARAEEGYVCDFGFSPLLTWTCDDLVPYYTGYSLQVLHMQAAQEPIREKRTVALDEFVAYDPTGHTWTVPPPAFAPPP
jgi:hypothetical protein